MHLSQPHRFFETDSHGPHVSLISSSSSPRHASSMGEVASHPHVSLHALPLGLTMLTLPTLVLPRVTVIIFSGEEHH